MKRLLLIGMFLIGSILVLNSCTDWTSDVSKEPKFAGMIEKLYKTEKDLVVMGDRRLVLDEPGTSGVPLIKDLKKEVPYRYEGDTIHGIFYKGTVVRLKRVLRSRSLEYGNMLTYEAKVESEGMFKGKVIDVFIGFDEKDGKVETSPDYLVEAPSK